MICKKCNSTVNESSKICPKCGITVKMWGCGSDFDAVKVSKKSDIELAHERHEIKKSPNKAVITVIAALVAVVGVTAVLTLFLRKDNMSANNDKVIPVEEQMPKQKEYPILLQDEMKSEAVGDIVRAFFKEKALKCQKVIK